MPEPSLTLVVLTKNSGKNGRLRRLLDWSLTIPEITHRQIYIDSTNSDRQTPVVAESYGIVPSLIAVKNIDSALAYCHSEENIRTDWALHLGDDEVMGEWFREDIAELLAAPFDVYSFPRYNMISKEEYIPELPWYPDWAQRLFRPGSLHHRGEVHEGAEVRGRLSMARPHIFHWDFIDMTREEREARWQRYLKQGVVEVSRKRGLQEDYYRLWSVPEDYDHTAAKCEEKL